jgi:Domain of unknown function (DUF4352)
VPQYSQPPQYGQQAPYLGQQLYRRPPPPKKKAGRRILGFGCLGIVAIFVLVVIGVAVSGSKANSTVNTTAAGTHAARAAAGASSAASKPAGVGDAIDLSDSSGDKIAVTMVKTDANAAATDGFSTPPAGDKYYGVQVQIKDVGSIAWSDSPSNCMVVKDGKGQQFQTDIVQSISSGSLMSATVNLAAGDSALGWIVFDVLTGNTMTAVQFTPDSGTSSDTGQWSIG